MGPQDTPSPLLRASFSSRIVERTKGARRPASSVGHCRGSVLSTDFGPGWGGGGGGSSRTLHTGEPKRGLDEFGGTTSHRTIIRCEIEIKCSRFTAAGERFLTSMTRR